MIMVAVAIVGRLVGLNDPNAPYARGRARSLLTFDGAGLRVLTLSEPISEVVTDETSSVPTAEDGESTTRSNSRTRRDPASVSITDSPLFGKKLEGRPVLSPWNEVGEASEEGSDYESCDEEAEGGEVGWREGFEMRRRQWGGLAPSGASSRSEPNA